MKKDYKKMFIEKLQYIYNNKDIIVESTPERKLDNDIADIVEDILLADQDLIETKGYQKLEALKTDEQFMMQEVNNRIKHKNDYYEFKNMIKILERDYNTGFEGNYSAILTDILYNIYYYINAQEDDLDNKKKKLLVIKQYIEMYSINKIEAKVGIVTEKNYKRSGVGVTNNEFINTFSNHNSYVFKGIEYIKPISAFSEDEKQKILIKK